MVFWDISNFSKTTKGKNAKEIAQYLDKYYDIIIPLIYKHDGVIEKIIGDGIIAIFGEPFTSGNIDSLLVKAHCFAAESLSKLKDNQMSAKCALVEGEVMYYSTIPSEYLDFTIVGEIITNLFRLESISKDGTINYYENSKYDKLINRATRTTISSESNVDYKLDGPEEYELQGIGMKTIKSITPISSRFIHWGDV